MNGIVDVQADSAAVARRAADWLLERALATPGRFAWCLSGGSTPKATYTLLAQEPYRSRFPWERTHVFFGDERFVPPDHPDSNYRMARDAMLSHVLLPDVQVQPVADGRRPGARRPALRRHAQAVLRRSTRWTRRARCST